MIEIIFTVDYEIYGNGQGSLKELIYEPAQKLMTIFMERNLKFVTFVEVAELEMIEAYGTDPAIGMVKTQVKSFYDRGFELGLHLHTQWYNARCEKGRWYLDYDEYNLCTLPKERVIKIVERSLEYFRNILSVYDFTPFSFRAGNWLFQPTEIVANVLAERGIKVDSSVFKGGLQHQHRLDYRRALKNGYYWKFTNDANLPDSKGVLLELPIHTQMVPTWKMFTGKRVGLQKKGPSTSQVNKTGLYRILDLLRFWYPLKLDFCRMSIDELIRMLDRVIQEDQRDLKTFRPIVAIGHTKDLIDFETIKFFLSYLENKKISVSTFKDVYSKCT
jgi:hypothetical protein